MATKSFTGRPSKNLSAHPDTDLHICFPPLPNRPEAPRPSFARRKVSPVSGRALEILGHAIEHLADEYVLKAAEMGTLQADDPRIDAMHILMALNREVYYACPEVEPALSRLTRWLSRSRIPRAPRRTWN
jgi:hypothetical protein